jgi:hypothetical protein
MDMLNTLIGDKGGDLVASLLKQGFDNNNANTFLREAGGSISSAVTSGKVDLSQGGISDQVGALLKNIDITALASRVGIKPELAQSGLNTVLPTLLQLLQQGGGQGIGSLLSGAGSTGDLLNMAKKLF